MFIWVFFFVFCTDAFTETQPDRDSLQPVDKAHALLPEYIPKDLVLVGNYKIPTRGHQMVRACIIEDLRALFNAARKDGVHGLVTSAYRSYSEQKRVFNNWKKREIARGLSEKESFAKATTYSAQAGHSEHQLGTTVDIIAESATGFVSSAENNRVWEWLAEHCEEYGFVISYPKDKEKLTGYIYEPWHMRWIGKEHAQALKKKRYQDPETSITLAEYLHDFLRQNTLSAELS